MSNAVTVLVEYRIWFITLMVPNAFGFVRLLGIWLIGYDLFSVFLKNPWIFRSEDFYGIALLCLVGFAISHIASLKFPDVRPIRAFVIVSLFVSAANFFLNIP